MEFKELKNLPRISRNGEKSLLGVWIKANEENDKDLVLLCEYAMTHQDYKSLNIGCMGLLHSAVMNIKKLDRTRRLFKYLTTEDLELELLRRKSLSPNARKKEGMVTFLQLYKG